MDTIDLNGKVTGDINISSIDFHGTHVAGIAGAKANNGLGIRGVDWNAQLISKRIFEYGEALGDFTIANKIIEAVNEGANILNHSYGAPAVYYLYSVLNMAFTYAYNLNVLNVSIMHNYYNYGNPIIFPANFRFGNIAVGSTTDLDQKITLFTNGISY